MRTKKYLLSVKAISVMAVVLVFAVVSGGLLFASASEGEPDLGLRQEEIQEAVFFDASLAELKDVYLINSDVLEIEYSEPVIAAQAQMLFSIKVDGVEVEWEFLSYFNFGDYGKRGGVVNIRLQQALDTGDPRSRTRGSPEGFFLDGNQSVKGPVAATRITLTVANETRTAKWQAFYTERSLGYMSRVYAYAAAEAGNSGQQIRDYGTDYTAGNIFSATTEPRYTEEFIARQVAEGMHRFCGRSEFLTLPFIESGFKALLVGASQSVYEVPEFRELYVHGETGDTYTRTAIKATDVPGNFLGNGKFKKPFIVGTADDVMRHYSPLQADGSPAGGDADSARPRSDYFHFGEAFFDIYYEIGVKVGCPRFPLGPDNDPDDYRFDLQLVKFYNNAKAAGKWPGTAMMNSVKDYYLYGAMVHWEFIPESWEFREKSFPVNTRVELSEYDYDLYRALCGIYGKYEYWTGVSTLQGASSIDDSSKWRTPWFWHNQPDNFGLPATADATLGVPYPPLAIESATIVAHNQIDIVFNREVRSVQSVADASNWAIYIDDRQLTGISEANGYNWKSIRLQTNCNVNFLTGAVTNSANRLDNGKPYGRYFTGFSQRDIEERKMSAGGWIYNFQQPGENALDFGQFISLQKAMDVYGAGARNAKIEVAYIGTDDACDWDGNILAKNLKHGIDKFEPWIGHAYRSPLTGVYIYLDTAVQNRYDAKTVAIAAAMHYEAHLQNNASITYPKSAGGDDFPASANQAWNVPVFYDRVGQRIADGAVADNGGMLIAAGSNLGNHPGMQPQSGALRGSSIGDSYRIEGWGISVLNSTVFQTEDVLVMRDYNLCRHRNESLIMHEAGHGIDSYAPAYAQNIYNDISAAHATATNALNGARWRDVDNVSAYCGARGEYASTLCAVYAGIMREQMMGINDGTWTPINTRSELYRYDPYGFEVFKRIFYTGELYLWYENKIGDPAYRVMPGDWEILRDTYPEFSHWQSENDLIQWGYSIPQTARRNPYMEARNGLPGRSQLNNAVRWVSWNVPDIWAPEPYKAPSNPLYPNNKYDFAGSSPYFSIPDPADPDGLQPLKNQVHPFARPGGVPKPKRPAELEALAKPLQGIITDNYAQILSRPVLVQFGFENYDGKITRDNAQTSFELQVNGKYTHFYLWEFKETAPGVATVTVRLDWPLEEGDIVAVSQPNPLIGLLGDIDGDGLITPEDAMTLLQMYVDLIPWTSRALLLGDINGDGIVDPIDAALILRLVVGG